MFSIDHLIAQDCHEAFLRDHIKPTNEHPQPEVVMLDEPRDMHQVVEHLEISRNFAPWLASSEA